MRSCRRRKRGPLVSIGLMLLAGSLALPSEGLATVSGANGRIVFQGDTGLFAMNPDGSRRVRLTNNSGHALPRWSPSGAKIAFQWSGIWTINPNGTGMAQVPSAAGAANPSWSPDRNEARGRRERSRDPDREPGRVGPRAADDAERLVARVVARRSAHRLRALLPGLGEPADLDHGFGRERPGLDRPRDGLGLPLARLVARLVQDRVRTAIRRCLADLDQSTRTAATPFN